MTNTQRAINLIRGFTGEFRAVDVTKPLGLSTKTSGYIFRQLIKDGFIKDVRTGHYLNAGKKPTGRYTVYERVKYKPVIDLESPINIFLVNKRPSSPTQEHSKYGQLLGGFK